MMETKKKGYTASLRVSYFDFDDCSQRICCSVGKKKSLSVTGGLKLKLPDDR